MNNPAQKNNKPQTAITPTRADDFPGWYQAVSKAADMAENSSVGGCMVIKPYGFALWENIQKYFDAIIKDLDVQNAYFPLLIPMSYLAKEAEHVEGFAKECAVVTHHRLEQGPKGGLVPAESAKLEEPLIIRPTSETIIGESMAKWVQSYRDLPLKLNQWCNVLRWEMRTRLFLRTAEFLWQEGHNAFETYDDAQEDALKMVHAYADFAEHYMAIPVYRGEKTADERFPGAIHTYAMEAMMQDGKALQAATSHNLGQNFAHSSEIKFQGREGKEEFAWTTSCGMSTRTIGGMIMVHGDDDGMIMPPRLAPVQIQIIPVMKDERDQALLDYCDNLKKQLKAKGLRAAVDTSEARTPDKMWGCVKKGVPIRVEIGGREMAEGKLTHVRRDVGKDSKATVSVDEFVNGAEKLLTEIHDALFARAKKFRDEHVFEVKSIKEVAEFFAADKVGFCKADVSLLQDKEWETIKKEYSLTPRCMPFEDKGTKVLIAKSY